jgi:uncharacterized repeat protein (TIGR02543 family)
MKKRFGSALHLVAATIALGCLNLLGCQSPAVPPEGEPQPTYTVTYDGNGSTGGSVPVDSGAYTGGATVKVLPNAGRLVKSGFNSLAGWTKSNDGSAPCYKPGDTFAIEKENVTLYAKWENLPEYLLKFDSNGGSVTPDQQVVQGNNALEPTAPTKPGNGFVGWYKDSSLDTPWNWSTDVVTGDLTLFAKWCPATDGLAYELINGGSEYSVAKGTVTEGSVVMPDYWAGRKVTAIQDKGFASTQITDISLSSNLRAISFRAFQYCRNLASITIPAAVTVIGEEAFDSCGLTAVSLPNGLETIGKNAFSFNTISSIIIPPSVKSLESYAFFSCRKLTSVTIPDSVTELGSGVFFKCTLLAKVRLPESLTSLPAFIFEECSSLNDIIIPAGVISIGMDAFSYCTKLSTLELPSNLVHIQDSAFSGCSGLTSLTIPETVTSIGAAAFYHCSGLTSLDLPPGIYTIKNITFMYCSSLTRIGIPAGVASIETEAFSECPKLARIDIKCPAPPALSADAFKNCIALAEIHVPANPASVIDLYKTADIWKNYASMIIAP